MENKEESFPKQITSPTSNPLVPVVMKTIILVGILLLLFLGLGAYYLGTKLP